MSSTIPPGIRRAAMATVVLAVLVGLKSAQDLAIVLDPPEVVVEAEASPGLESLGIPPEVARKAMEAATSVMLRGFAPFAGLRVLILLGLSFSTSLLMLSGFRLLRPGNLPLEPVRRSLVFAAASAAVFRTIDGAHMAAVAQRAGVAFGRVLKEQHASAPEGTEEFVPSLLAGTAAGLTLLVVTCLMLTWAFFRSEGARAWAGAHSPPSDD